MRGATISALSRALWLLAVPVIIVAVWFAAGLAGALIPGRIAPALPAGPPVTVWLVRGPIHYDLLLPLTPEVRERFAFAALGGVAVDAPGAAWLLVGWGARDFYRSAGSYADVQAGPVLRAVTGDRAVLRLQAFGEIDPAAAGLGRIDLAPQGLARLIDRIAADLTRDAAGQPILSQAPGLADTDAFWEAEGHFWALNTCNVWAGEVLRAAGVRLGAWTPTPQALALSLWWFGQAGGGGPAATR